MENKVKDITLTYFVREKTRRKEDRPIVKTKVGRGKKGNPVGTKNQAIRGHHEPRLGSGVRRAGSAAITCRGQDGNYYRPEMES